MKKEEQLKGLLGTFREIKKEADNCSSILDKTIFDATTSGVGVLWRQFHQYIGYKISFMIENYNNAVGILESIIEINDINVRHVSIEGGSEGEQGFQDVAEALTIMRIGSSSAIDYIEGITSIISTKEKGALNDLLTEIEQLETFNQPLYAHLVDSIEAYQKGNYIAASVTAAKVVVYCLEQIPGKNDEERVMYLIQQKLLDENLEEKYITAIRKVRNIFSHKIDYLPRPQDALSIITDGVKIALIIPKIKTK